MKALLVMFIVTCLQEICCILYDPEKQSIESGAFTFSYDNSSRGIPCYLKRSIKCNDKDKKYRRFNGACNNLQFPQWGLPNSSYSRLLPAAYSDGIREPRMSNDNCPLPGARKLRVTLLPTGSKLNKDRSLVSMQWGQIITHDMSLQMDSPDGPCCTGEGQCQRHVTKYCFPIKISPTDPDLGLFMNCMNFTKTFTDEDMGCLSTSDSPAQKINMVTLWMDLSLVYDFIPDRSENLRVMADGLMKVQNIDGNIFPPYEPNVGEYCQCNKPDENVCYQGGDSRTNQSPHLLLLQIILLREHNRLATELKNLNPKWCDEKLFQEARRINIAQFQHISYYEWMPVVFGFQNSIDYGAIFPDQDSYVNDYDPGLSPDVSNEHAHAAFRHFHSQIAEILHYMDNQRNTTSSINIGNFFNRPAIFGTQSSFGDLTRGLITQQAEESDQVNIPAITNKMLACNDDKFGFDLRSFDIQRDRDHANRYYNDYRKLCGLGEAKSFDDFEDYISRKNIKKLKRLYRSHADVDLTVGGSLESKYKGSQVGPTFMCIIMEQFKRTRRADRFFFEHKEAGFTKDQLIELKKSSLSRLMCDNEKSILKIQRNAFLLVKDVEQDLIPCSSIPVVNLEKWKK